MRRFLVVLLIGATAATASATEYDEDFLSPLVRPPPPPPAPAPPTPAVESASEPETSRRPLLVPSAGFGWATESGVAGPMPHLRVGFAFEYSFTRWLMAQVTVRDHFYRREYLLDRLDLTGRTLARVQLAEQKLDAEAFALFQLISGSRLRLSLGAGPIFRFFLNEALPSNVGALGLTGRADLALSPHVDLSIGAMWAYNLFFANAGLASALGPPRAITGYRAGFAFQFGPELRLTAGYEGEAVVLERSYRFFHSVVFALEVPLGAARITPAATGMAAAPHRGRLLGRVLDAVTKSPLANAVVSLPGHNRLLASASGSFSVTDLPPGPLTLKAELSGFAAAEATAVVTAGQERTIELLLKPLPKVAVAPPPVRPVTLKGSVISESGKPLLATLAVPSTGLSPKQFPGGDYELTTAAGELVIEASAQGHITQARRLMTHPAETVVTDFVLKPTPKKVLIVLRRDKIEIKQQVHFAVNRAVILPDSDQLLDQVAGAILENPQLARIRVEGHTDSQGNDAHNLDLSGRRARSVRQALIDRGVDASRLKAMGYGELQPIAANTSDKGRQQNRRVEFMIEASP